LFPAQYTGQFPEEQVNAQVLPPPQVQVDPAQSPVQSLLLPSQ
jgi:hypothetical protein